MKRPQSLKEPTDRRMAPRSRRNSQAEAHDASGRVLSVCVVRDQSETGARLVFPPGFTPPAQFVLLELNSSRRRPVTMVWTADREAGIAYAD